MLFFFQFPYRKKSAYCGISTSLLAWFQSSLCEVALPVRTFHLCCGLEAIVHCWMMGTLVSWLEGAKMKLTKFRTSEVSSSSGMHLNFQMTVTLKPIINITSSLWGGHLGERSGNEFLDCGLPLKWFLLHTAVWQEAVVDKNTELPPWEPVEALTTANYRKHKRYFKDLLMPSKQQDYGLLDDYSSCKTIHLNRCNH